MSIGKYALIGFVLVGVLGTILWIGLATVMEGVAEMERNMSRQGRAHRIQTGSDSEEK